MPQKIKVMHDAPPLSINICLTLIFQRSHVNYKAILHIAFQQALISRINILHIDQLYICSNIMLPAEIQHFLGFRNAADHRAREASAGRNQAECCYR